MGSESKVYVVSAADREAGVRQLLKRCDLTNLRGKTVALKANYNSADLYPASTHLDTLGAIVKALKESGSSVLMAERSGMGATRSVLEEMGVLGLAKKLGFEVVVLDELESDGWVKLEAVHWRRGYLFPKVFKDAGAIVQTCCLKTHRYGGHFTLSLKNTVGMVAKYDPGDGYNYMAELHTSRQQRRMIAEINAAYRPRFVVMDALKGFSRGGPDTGNLITPGIMLASADRAAIDAVGVAVLRMHGSTSEVSRGRIFELEQIARVAELGLGASAPGEIEVVPVNEDARDVCAGIEEKLSE